MPMCWSWALWRARSPSTAAGDARVRGDQLGITSCWLNQTHIVSTRFLPRRALQQEKQGFVGADGAYHPPRWQLREMLIRGMHHLL